MPYKECWELQQSLFESRLEIKRSGSEGEDCGTILTVEHTPVYTLGKSGKQSNMLIPETYLKSLGAEFFHIDRGGDITFHGPGQIVGYPSLDIDSLGLSLRTYIEAVEESVIRLMKDYSINCERLKGATGVWIDAHSSKARKICAIGVKASRGITMHGFALNVNTDLTYFNYINPCGFTDKGVTSMKQELGEEIDISLVERQLFEKFTSIL